MKETDIILCSTGALIGKPNGRDYRLLEPLSKQLTCDGFEFMMYRSWYENVKELIDTLQKINIYIPVMHCEKHIGEQISKGDKTELEEALHLFEINCQIADNIQAKKMVLHLWDGVTSDQHFSNNLNAYPYLAEIAQKYKIDLLIENVVCNQENPMKHWCELAKRYSDIHFIFDTKMAAFHNQLELLYAKDYEWLWKDKHIRHYHVNDYAGGYMDWDSLLSGVLPVGKGHINFERFFDFVYQTGYTGTYTVEATAFDRNGMVDVNMLNEQFSRIRFYLN